MADTTNTILTKILRPLRKAAESGSATLTDPYTLMILDFVNEAKRQLEDQFDWSALRKTITVTISAGTSSYDLTSAGPADADANVRSRLLYETYDSYGRSLGETSSPGSDGSRPLVWDTTSSTNALRLIEVSPGKMERLHIEDDDTQQASTYFSISSDLTADNLIMKLWPTPSAAITQVQLRMVVPQADLAATTPNTTTMTIPGPPVWTQALLLAASERGAELGIPLPLLQKNASDALWDALVRESFVEYSELASV